MKKDIETSLVSFLTKFPDFFRQRADSLEEFNAVLYNEHITLIEQSLIGTDVLPGLLDKIQTLLACSQLTSISLLIGVPEVDILGTLDKISTKRNPLDAAVRSGSRLATFAAGESTRGLPSYDNLAMAVGESSRRGRNVNGNFTGAGGKYEDYSTRDGDNINQRQSNNKNSNNTFVQAHDQSQNDNSNTTINEYGSKKGQIATGLQKDAVKQLVEQEGLSLGKQFSARFERDGNSVELLMRLRLDTKSMPTDMIKTLIAFSDQCKTFSERLLSASVGGKSYAKDIFFSNDLIDQYRKNRFRDKTGYYKRMMEQKNGNWLSGLLTFSPSINNASSVMVVSSDTLDSLTPELGGDFDDMAIRSRVFKDTLTVYYVVVDTLWKRVRLYTRGQSGYIESDFSEFTKSKGGSNVNQIIEAYRSGAQPVL